jgi:hypothetical protein
MGRNKIYRRLSVDFMVDEDEDKRIPSKHISILDSDGKEIVSGELYEIGYEDEEGNECDKEGNPLLLAKIESVIEYQKNEVK